ncbi:MAG: class I SAM-dependent methyltransferase [Actinomycetota bacterium]
MRSAKDSNYFHLAREELHTFAAANGLKYEGRLLSVGCAAGIDAPSLRARGITELHGIEPDPGAASQAQTAYDRVFCGPVEEWNWDGEPYDIVVFADVLEHLVAPDSVLRSGRDWLRPNGQLLISIPNVRHLSIFWELFVRGEWNYRESGILDSTHLRFFTRRSFIRLLSQTGFQPTAMQRWGATLLLRRLDHLLPGTGELFLSQIFFLARVASETGSVT